MEWFPLLTAVTNVISLAVGYICGANLSRSTLRLAVLLEKADIEIRRRTQSFVRAVTPDSS